MINNHTAVWGSWWHDGAWGYACCHSTIKQSYCVGAAGAAAAAEQADQLAANLEKKAADDEEKRAASKLVGHKPSADVWGDAADEQLQAELDPQKVLDALKRQEAAERTGEEGRDDRKRGYNSLAAGDADVTPEEMEAYRCVRAVVCVCGVWCMQDSRVWSMAPAGPASTAPPSPPPAPVCAQAEEVSGRRPAGLHQ